MIYKWGFVSLEFFQEILKSYLGGDSIYNNKIIEVQNSGSLLLGEDSLSRVYFSRYTRVQDWEQYNPEMQHFERYLDEKEKNGEIDKNSVNWKEKLNEKARVFMIPTRFEQNELILYPISNNEEIQKCLDTFITFDQKNPDPSYTFSMIALPVYFSKKGRKWEYMNLTATERYIRMRTIDVEDWKKIVTKALEKGKLEGCENDLRPMDIVLNDDGIFSMMRRKMEQVLGNMPMP